jgi:hypothetical protein
MKAPENDYSTPEAQQAFFSLPKSEQEKEVDRAHSEALVLNHEINQMAEGKNRFITSLNRGDITAALKILRNSALPDTLLTSPEVLRAAEAGFLSRLNAGRIYTALSIRKEFALSDTFLTSPEVLRAAEAGFLSCLNRGDITTAREIRKEFALSDTFLTSPEVLRAAEAGFLFYINEGRTYDAFEIRKEFAFPDTFFTSPEALRAAEAGFLSCLNEGRISDASEIRKEFALPEDMVLRAAEAGFLSHLNAENITAALAIRKNFALPDTFLTSPEVLRAAEVLFLSRLKAGNINLALNIRKEFALPEDVVEAPLSEFLTRMNFPLSAKETLRLIETDRFGKNLLSRFGKLDRAAQDAISRILVIDRDSDPTIDRRSLAYRMLAQTALADFSSNPHITAAMTEAGVDVAQWLAYPDEEYFELEPADNLSLGEQIAQPIARLSESLRRYLRVITAAIAEYKTELQETTITEDTKPLDEEIAQLESKIVRVTDQRKRESMERGLASLLARREHPKRIRLWDKLHAEIDKLVKLGEEIARCNERLIAIETSRTGIVDTDSVERAKDKKGEFWELRQMLTSRVKTLSFRLKGLMDMYRDTLASAIGVDRADGIIQQIRSELRIEEEHLQIDFSTIFSFLREPEDEDVVDGEEVMDDDQYRFNPREAAALVGRPMSIRIASRSRQDLYIGNYTTCCIRIDSDSYGSESPIADYVTDLGMQNVLIYDEVTKTPIACAWCWIGEDPETKETALVVDNVEGWQKYTVNFRSQLEARLRSYLIRYAQAIRVSTLSQGPDYNDLNVLPQEKQEKRFRKLGGYNRANGYYLEAKIKNREDDAGGGNGEDGEEWE